MRIYRDSALDVRIRARYPGNLRRACSEGGEVMSTLKESCSELPLSSGVKFRHRSGLLGVVSQNKLVRRSNGASEFDRRRVFARWRFWSSLSLQLSRESEPNYKMEAGRHAFFGSRVSIRVCSPFRPRAPQSRSVDVSIFCDSLGGCVFSPRHTLYDRRQPPSRRLGRSEKKFGSCANCATGRRSILRFVGLLRANDLNKGRR